MIRLDYVLWPVIKTGVVKALALLQTPKLTNFKRKSLEWGDKHFSIYNEIRCKQ